MGLQITVRMRTKPSLKEIHRGIQTSLSSMPLMSFKHERHQRKEKEEGGGLINEGIWGMEYVIKEREYKWGESKTKEGVHTDTLGGLRSREI